MATEQIVFECSPANPNKAKVFLKLNGQDLIGHVDELVILLRLRVLAFCEKARMELEFNPKCLHLVLPVTTDQFPRLAWATSIRVERRRSKLIVVGEGRVDEPVVFATGLKSPS